VNTLEKLIFEPRRECEARDRAELIVNYLRALMVAANDQFNIATEDIKLKESGTAACHGFCMLEVAREYLEELAKLQDRPMPDCPSSLETESN